MRPSLLLGELPRPLCLLHRIQFAMVAVGPILNVRFGPRSSHFGISLLVAIAGEGFAARQILLHIMLGDAGYGLPLLGYHYYTWAFIGFSIALFLLAVMLLFDRQFVENEKDEPFRAVWFGRAAIWVRLPCGPLR
jgi:disulfide bond formation protein DsbB